MAVREIVPGIYAVGAPDFDRRLFDSLIPLPNGTSYNAYLVRGEKKTALVDTVDPAKELDLVTNLVKARIESIDYIVSNHAEQDHSGSLPMMAELFPRASIVVNEKSKDLVVRLLDVDPNRLLVVRDGDTLDLGRKTLRFLITPWVHWPETMVTYAVEDRVLFSCDLFGTHYADSSLFMEDEREVYSSAKRYYAEIMMPFRTNIAEHMQKLKDLPISIIAPSHGPVYSRPEIILSAYREWISDDVADEVVVPYVSMHGSTEKMVGAKHSSSGISVSNPSTCPQPISGNSQWHSWMRQQSSSGHPRSSSVRIRRQSMQHTSSTCSGPRPGSSR